MVKEKKTMLKECSELCFIFILIDPDHIYQMKCIKADMPKFRMRHRRQFETKFLGSHKKWLILSKFYFRREKLSGRKGQGEERRLMGG
jgi:hypothetical protein